MKRNLEFGRSGQRLFIDAIESIRKTEREFYESDFPISEAVGIIIVMGSGNEFQEIWTHENKDADRDKRYNEIMSSIDDEYGYK